MSSRVNFDIFSGSSVPDLARGIAEILDTDIGHIDVSKFSDGEIKVELMENVRVMKPSSCNQHHIPQMII